MATRRFRTRTETRVAVEGDRGVFMISVAAELADMHPQTLRMYEARGLIEPQRSPKGTRLYSQEDVERLRGEGPQRLSDRGRGDIHYRFVIDVPKDLSPEQEEALDGLSRVMNGAPRATLLRDAKKAAT